MSHKQLAIAAAFALLSGAALAMEATEFAVEPSTRSRADVLAELAQAQANGEIVRGEADQSFDRTIASVRSRDAVRAEAYAAARDHSFNELYIA